MFNKKIVESLIGKGTENVSLVLESIHGYLERQYNIQKEILILLKEINSKLK